MALRLIDALVFTSLQGVVASPGRHQKDSFFTFILALLGTYRRTPDAVALFEVAIVDGTTGELLWANCAGAAFFGEIDARHLVDAALGGFAFRFDSPEERPAPSTAGTPGLPAAPSSSSE